MLLYLYGLYVILVINNTTLRLYLHDSPKSHRIIVNIVKSNCLEEKEHNREDFGMTRSTKKSCQVFERRIETFKEELLLHCCKTWAKDCRDKFHGMSGRLLDNKE